MKLNNSKGSKIVHLVFIWNRIYRVKNVHYVHLTREIGIVSTYSQNFIEICNCLGWRKCTVVDKAMHALE